MLKELTWTYVIEAQELTSQQQGQRRIIRELFKIFNDVAADNSKLFPVFYRERLADVKKDHERTRIVVDLIAGLTERQAIASYQQLTGISLGSGLDAILV
jgi:dGTPase